MSNEQNSWLWERSAIIQGAYPANYTGAAATVSGQWIDMGQGTRLHAIINIGAFAGGTPAVTWSQATTATGTSAKLLTSTYANYNTSSQTADAYTANAITSGTFNLGTGLADTLVVVGVMATDLDAANGFQFAQLQIATPGSNNDYYSFVYILDGLRFPQLAPASVLV